MNLNASAGEDEEKYLENLGLNVDILISRVRSRHGWSGAANFEHGVRRGRHAHKWCAIATAWQPPLHARCAGARKQARPRKRWLDGIQAG